MPLPAIKRSSSSFRKRYRLKPWGDAEVQYFQLDYTKFVPHLIEAIKELAATVSNFAEKIVTKELVATNRPLISPHRYRLTQPPNVAQQCPRHPGLLPKSVSQRRRRYSSNGQDHNIAQ